MSMETNGKYPQTSAPFQQWQNFYPPYAYEPHLENWPKKKSA